MIDELKHFFYMGGYSFYVWSAYGSVIAFLLLQWLLAEKRWQHYLHQQNKLTNE
jgi:heme exporter protein CcmD